jgi:hypothetical protein
LEKYSEIFAGGKIVAEIVIDYDPSSEKAENVSLEYFIEDSSGDVLASASELINVKGETKILRELDVPDGVEVGKYWIVAKVKYNDISASGKDVFEIVDEDGVLSVIIEEGSYLWLLLIIIILLLIIIVLLVIRKKRRCKKRVARKKHLKKIVSYIGEEI